MPLGEKHRKSITPGMPFRVLVVDDQPGLAQTLAMTIAKVGTQVNVRSASSAKQALELADRDPIDILITDMVMPDMTGLELVEKFQKHPGGRPSYTILMTAYEVPGLKETARRLNIRETIIKPFHPERMNQLVIKAIETIPSFSEPPLEVGIQPYKILVADDVPDNITLMTRYIQNEGFQFVTAANGNEAIQQTRTEMPDLILLDVNMPDKDGFTVLKELRDDPVTQHLPVIILTAARPHPSDIQTGLVLGADDYITKPFDRRELFARIRTKLRLKEARDTLMRRNRELAILPEIGKELGAKLNLEDIAALVLKRSVEALGALHGHIVILNFKNPFHREYYVSQHDTQVSENRIPLFNNLLDEIQESPQCILIEDSRKDIRWQAPADGLGESVMVVPISGREKLIGLLILTNEKTGYFTQEHCALAQAIASQAGIALENCRLYDEVARGQERVSAVLNSVADSILMFDAEGCLSMLNPAAELLFKDQNLQLGLPLIQGAGNAVLIEALDRTFESGRATQTEITSPDGRVFTALLTPLLQGGCVVLLHDISHFKSLERVKNEFIANASHDLRNPLTTIRGYSQLVMQTNGLDDMQVDFLRRIHNASRNMGELVDNMLDLAKMDLNEELKPQPLDLPTFLGEIADEFKPQAEAKDQEFMFVKNLEQLSFHGEVFKLRQAFANLISNAIKYTPPQGSVRIALELEEQQVVVRVQDTGYGIPAKDLPHLFKRFYRVRNNGHDDIDGNGLGLAIVKTIIEKHGGQIHATSEPGQGSCFTVTLPVNAPSDSQCQSIASVSYQA